MGWDECREEVNMVGEDDVKNNVKGLRTNLLL